MSTTLLNDINDRGQSTGQAFDAADPRNTHYAFLRERDGTITTLPDAPGAAQTIHIGLNNRGQTAATAAFLSADGTFATLRGFRYDDGEPTRIAVPGAVSTFATAINDRGHMVGYYTDPAPGTTGPSAAAAAADGAAGMPMGQDPLAMMDPMLPNPTGATYAPVVWPRPGVHLAAEGGWQRRTGVVDEHDHEVGRTHGQGRSGPRRRYTDSCIVRPAILADGVGGKGSTSPDTPTRSASLNDPPTNSPFRHRWQSVLRRFARR